MNFQQGKNKALGLNPKFGGEVAIEMHHCNVTHIIADNNCNLA